jgi:spore germination protein YaaH
MKLIYNTLTLFILFLLLPVATFSASRSLTLGLSGTDVKEVQTKLIARGYLSAGSNTGYFGAQTLSAVKKFQCDKKIACSASVNGYGVVGPKTLASLLDDSPTSKTTGGILTGKSLTGKATGAFEFSGWIPDWRAASGTADVLPHLDKLKSVMPFAYEVSSSGRLIDHAKITEEPWPSFIAEAKRKKVRVIPTVMWGDGEAIHKILSNAVTRIALEDEIANLVKQSGFDGIDIDFEAKQSKTRDYFSTFLKGLYQRLPGKWVYCTVEARQPLIDRFSPGAKIPEDATDFANDYREMNKYCDRIEIMAYDQGTINLRLNAARSAPYAPVADPGWVESLVTLAAQDISKNKIIIGVPTYGYEYLVTPVNGSYKYERLWAFNPQYAIQIANKLGITPYRTSANEMGFTYDPNALSTVAPTGGNVTLTQQTSPTTTVVQNDGSQIKGNKPFNYMTWSDARAIADKVELAHELGVRGIAVFSLGGAEDQAMWDILK